MTNDIQWIHGGIPGFRILGDSEAEGQKLEEGAILALRRGGDEALFASLGEEADERRRGLSWIPIGDFAPDPAALPVAEDFVEEEPPGGSPTGEDLAVIREGDVEVRSAPAPTVVLRRRTKEK